MILLFAVARVASTPGKFAVPATAFYGRASRAAGACTFRAAWRFCSLCREPARGQPAATHDSRPQAALGAGNDRGADGCVGRCGDAAAERCELRILREPAAAAAVGEHRFSPLPDRAQRARSPQKSRLVSNGSAVNPTREQAADVVRAGRAGRVLCRRSGRAVR